MQHKNTLNLGELILYIIHTELTKQNLLLTALTESSLMNYHYILGLSITDNTGVTADYYMNSEGINFLLDKLLNRNVIVGIPKLKEMFPVDESKFNILSFQLTPNRGKRR